jgi:transposase
MIDTQTIFEIHHLKEQGMSERKIAKTLHLTRKTVRKYLVKESGTYIRL